MTSTLNPHFISELEATPTNQITDAVDSIHSGIVKALHLAARGTYALKDTGADFDITQSSSSSVTRLAVKGGKAYRDGVLVTLGSGVGTTTNIDCAANYDPGTGAVDVTPVSGGDVYLFLVGNSSDALVLRGTNGTTGKVPELVEGDVPIAIVKVTASSADDATDRPIQYLTTSKVSNAISLGYNNSGYTEMSKITAASGGTTVEVGTAGGDFIIDNTDADKKIVMRLGSDDANTDFEVRNNSDAAKFSVDALGDTVVGRDLTITGGDINYSNAQDSTLKVAATTSTTAGRDLTIEAGSTSTNGNNIDGGDLILKAGGGDGTGTSIMTFHTKRSGTDAVVERMRIHTNGMVGIAETAPIAPLHVKYSSTDDATPALLLESTNDSSTSSPDIKLYRNSASPADNDYIGHLVFTGNNDAGTPEEIDYAHIYAIISDYTDGTEDGTLAFRTKVAGANVDVMTIKSGNVGIGTDAPAQPLHVERLSSSTENLMIRFRDSTVNAVGERIGIEGYWNTVPAGHIEWELRNTSSGASDIVFSPHSSGGTTNEVFRITSGGNVGIGTDQPNQPLTVEGTVGLKEQAAANADTAAYGQIWVKTNTPNELWFTDDAGNDVPLAAGGVNAAMAYSASDASKWAGGSPPTTVGAALDRLATWATAVNSAMGGGVGQP